MPGFEWFGDAERKEVSQVMETGVLMRYGFDAKREGVWKCKELEALISEKFGVNHCQLTSSGTTALNTALAVAGIGAGDEVIVPTFTFVATFESILNVGAIPIIVDIDESLTLDPKAVIRAITPKTKAIIPVHMCGCAADLDALMSICEEHKLILIEDACQATGASYKGKSLGSFGAMGCFSFDYVKIITMGEGGALITNDPELAKRADAYTDHGHDHIGTDRGAESHPFLGTNYRVNELNAAIGIAQFNRLEDILRTNRRNKAYLKGRIAAEVPEIKFRINHSGDEDNATFLSFFLPDTAKARQAQSELSKAGVGAVFHYYDNNWHYIRKWNHLKDRSSLNKLSKEIEEGMPDYSKTTFPVSDDIIGRNLSMLINLSWTEEELHKKGDAMVEILKNCVG